MPPYLFLQTDYDGLLSEIDQLKSQIRAIKAQVGVSTSQSSETWHDNIEHEELIRVHAKIVQRDQANNKIQLGSIINYDYETSINHTVCIGSYRQFGDRHGVIAYEAPLAQALLDKKLGQKIEFSVGTRTKSLTITKITNPSE